VSPTGTQATIKRVAAWTAVVAVILLIVAVFGGALDLVEPRLQPSCGGSTRVDVDGTVHCTPFDTTGGGTTGGPQP
jgi:hypothetical protein